MLFLIRHSFLLVGAAVLIWVLIVWDRRRRP
jgi:hypothetical protein